MSRKGERCKRQSAFGSHTPRTKGALTTKRALGMPFRAQTTTDTAPAVLDRVYVVPIYGSNPLILQNITRTDIQTVYDPIVIATLVYAACILVGRCRYG